MNKIHIDRIEKLSRSGNYEITCDLRLIKDQIERYISNYSLNLDPDFQRNHVWTEKMQIKFIEYLVKGGKSQALRFNHTNWMSFRNDTTNDEMVIVDGKQRLTAILKFVNNELSIFHDLTENKQGILYSNIDGYIDCTILINVNNLKTKKEVVKWYIELNENNVAHTEDEINKAKDIYNNL